MKAMINDAWYTTIDSAFVKNTDGVKREVLDTEEVRKAFDFSITKFKSFTEDGREIPKHWHLRRDDTNDIVPSRGLGDEYKPIQHAKIYDYVVTEIMPKIPDFKLESVGTMHGGGTGIICATLGEEFSIRGDKSPHQIRLFICNPNNGKGSCICSTSTVRFFCQNQIPAAIRQAKKRGGFSISHTTNADIRIENAVETIYSELVAARDLRLREERLAKIPVSTRDLNNVINKLIPLYGVEEGSRAWTRRMNEREAIVEQFESAQTAQTFTEDSAFKLLNAATYTIYNPESLGKDTDLAQIRFSGTVGSRAQKAARILSLVEHEVGIAA